MHLNEVKGLKNEGDHNAFAIHPLGEYTPSLYVMESGCAVSSFSALKSTRFTRGTSGCLMFFDPSSSSSSSLKQNGKKEIPDGAAAVFKSNKNFNFGIVHNISTKTDPRVFYAPGQYRNALGEGKKGGNNSGGKRKGKGKEKGGRIDTKRKHEKKEEREEKIKEKRGKERVEEEEEKEKRDEEDQEENQKEDQKDQEEEEEEEEVETEDKETNYVLFTALPIFADAGCTSNHQGSFNSGATGNNLAHMMWRNYWPFNIVPLAMDQLNIRYLIPDVSLLAGGSGQWHRSIIVILAQMVVDRWKQPSSSSSSSSSSFPTTLLLTIDDVLPPHFLNESKQKRNVKEADDVFCTDRILLPTRLDFPTRQQEGYLWRIYPIVASTEPKQSWEVHINDTRVVEAYNRFRNAAFTAFPQVKRAPDYPTCFHKHTVWLYTHIDACHRRMLNWKEVAQVLRDDFGFANLLIFHSFELPFEKQMELFATTSLLVTSHGAHMANGVFLPRGAAVVEMYPEGKVYSWFYFSGQRRVSDTRWWGPDGLCHWAGRILPGGKKKKNNYWRNDTLYEKYADFIPNTDPFYGQTCHQDYVVDIPMFKSLLRDQVLVNNQCS